MLLDSGTRKIFISKQCYLKNKSLHNLSTFNSKSMVIQVGNGASVNIFFIILIIVTIEGQMLEIYVMVSEIHHSVDLVLGIKNFIEFEKELTTKHLKFKFFKQANTCVSCEQENFQTKRNNISKGGALFLKQIR